jgi:DNA-binding MarR family transcriptional regulator
VDQDRRAEYVERWARALEQQGQPRIAGRIYGHLATAAEPYLSQQELADQLGVSRASISTNTARLVQHSLVVRVAVPGSRIEHYALDVEGTQASLVRVAQSARRLQDLAAEGLELQPGVLTPGTQNLRQMVDIYGQVAATLEQYAVRPPGRKPAPERAAAKRAAR